MAPGQPADATAEGVADDADVTGCTGKRSEAVLGHRCGDVAPQRTRAHPRGQRPGIEVDTGHP
jgi:hypothetical protein